MGTPKTLTAARAAVEAAVTTMENAAEAIEALRTNEDATDEQRSEAQSAFDAAEHEHDEAVRSFDAALKAHKARQEVGGLVIPESARMSVVHDEQIYVPGASHGYFLDQWHAKKGDQRAAERLRRHNEVTRDIMKSERAVTTAAGSADDLVPPLYVQDEFLPLIRAGRVQADLCSDYPMPENTNSITIPRLATGTTVSKQAGELGAVADTGVTTGSDTWYIETVAAKVDMSRQAFERSNPALDRIVFADLFAAYAIEVDRQVFVGADHASNEVKGLDTLTAGQTRTFTTATPKYTGDATAANNLFPLMAALVGEQVQERMLPPQVWVMHPRRWYWLVSQTDSSGRPFIPTDSLGDYPQSQVFERLAAESVVGRILSIPVVIDPSVPTNKGVGTDQDVIFLERASDFYLSEDGAPRTNVYEELLSGNLEIRVQIYNYIAFFGERRLQSLGRIDGTGLKDDYLA